jgi:Outer membrane protein
MRPYIRLGTLLSACLLAAPLTGCFVKPNPIGEEEQWQRAVEDMGNLFIGQESPNGAISLPEAVARAIQYNLDHRLAQMEASFHLKQLDVANLNMLPRVAFNAGYSIRNNESASSSISYLGRYQSLEPSVSSEVNHWTGDLSFSWSVLDFGLSYFQARQQADRYLILQERRRRILNNLVKDVIVEYFRVATAESIGDKINETLARAEAALATYKQVEEERKAPLQQTLEQQRSLLSIIGHLRLVSMQLATARSRLAALMNLPLSDRYTIVAPVDGELKPPVLSAELSDLETIGLYLRPDLREETYQARIDQYEVKKEILRMAPGISIFNNGNYDDNKYLTHQAWAEAGIRATVDIVGMAGKFKQVKASKAQVEVARSRRMANTLAALVQINMSYFQYRQAIEMYNDSGAIYGIENKLLDLSVASAKAREVGEIDEIRQSAATLNARLERDHSLIDVLSAWGNLYYSVGGDVLTHAGNVESLNQLGLIVADGLANWLSGGLPPLPMDAPKIPNNCIAASSGAALAALPIFAVDSGGGFTGTGFTSDGNQPQDPAPTQAETESPPADRQPANQPLTHAAMTPMRQTRFFK